ncbi:hypothetical protein [Neobacillus mesonae]|uniref:hypothetical protein n=1 Tax=Neobacillus mesonae TaxID=1193713 RepID=UPI00203A4E82|nr:hypothetical protein [Neobacillus mesonae]MCM3567767.1 hypothetical protein [Neobacillus mesonae]
MSQQKRENQQAKSYQQGSGSKYHEEHAGKVTGYGEMDPIAENINNRADLDSPSS